MIWHESEHLIIRNMIPEDAEVFTKEEIEQGWNQTEEKYRMRLAHQNENQCIALTAVFDGCQAGYISIYFKASHGPFAGSGCPEIVDFGVLEKYRCRGIGTALMDTAEKIASAYGDIVCLGVGLHGGYGSAQRMYAKRGYIPDGSGVWYDDHPCMPYARYAVDDSLILHLYKALR